VKKVSIIVLLWAALLLVPMCQKPGLEEAKVTETELNPLEARELNQAVVTFLSGDVSVLREQTWKLVDIGDSVEQEDTLKVGEDSFCELQFGDKASVRIQENTEVALSTILLEPGETDVNVKMAVGSILCKVGKLTGDERFGVRTSTATCGVRGTEFMVKEERDRTTTLAVKEGAVAVLPATVDVEKLKQRAGRENEAVIKRIEKLEQEAPVVGANEEIAIEESVLRDTEEAFKVVEEAVEEIVQEVEQKKPQVSAEKLEKLDQKIDAAIQKSSQQLGPPKEVSQENKKQLNEIEKIRTVSIPVTSVGFMGAKVKEAPAEAEKKEEPAPGAAAEEKPKPVELVKIAIKVRPEDAEVYLNDSFVGKGGFSGIFNTGEELSLLIKRDGYGEKQLKIKAEIGSDREYLVELREIKRAAKAEVAVSAEQRPKETPAAAEEKKPKPAEVEEAKKEVAVEAEQAPEAVAKEEVTPREEPKKEAAKAEKPPEAAVREEPVVREEIVEAEPSEEVLGGPVELPEVSRVEEREEPELQETVTARVVKTQTIVVYVSPPDAEILLNGSFVNRGSYSGEFEHGKRLLFTMSRYGYFDKSLNIFISENIQSTYTVTLEPKPIVSTFSVSKDGIVGTLALHGDTVISADSQGRLSAAGKNGEILWTLSTQNRPNALGFPLVILSRIYFTGPREFVIADARSGSVVTREALDENSCHLFGRRIVQMGSKGLFPCNDALRVFDLETGKIQEEITIPEGSRMTPSVYLGNILLVNQTGEFLILDPLRRGVFLRIPTAAVQPVAGDVKILKDATHGDLAFFGGRRGTVVCVSLSRKKVLWERKLPKNDNGGIYQDLECGAEGVFVFSGDRIYGLSVENGRDLFKPIQGVSSAPLYEKGQLYFGANRQQFVIADAASGKTLKSLYVQSRITTRPVLQDAKVYVGTETGQIVIINPQGMK
jgi:outer membrane protein assembly factor BamB